MSKLEFKPEDFGGLAREYWFPEMLERANARLAEMLKDSVRVYAHDDSPPIWGTLWTLEPAKQLNIPIHHTALLVNIEAIEGKP